MITFLSYLFAIIFYEYSEISLSDALYISKGELIYLFPLPDLVISVLVFSTSISLYMFY